jgi:hypothetical protein
MQGQTMDKKQSFDEPNHPSTDDSGEKQLPADQTNTIPAVKGELSLQQIKSITTMTISPQDSPLELLFNDMQPKVAPDTVAIHIPGKEQPLTFHNREEITLGRSGSSSLSLPDIDIIGREGILLGVSRQHAVIRRSEQGYFLHDLNSTNGTWHNGKKLIPEHPYRLNSGDQIRLGEQLMFIYFSSTGRKVDHTLYFKDRTRLETEDLRGGISIPYLLDKVGPFLRTLTHVQQVLDEAQNLPSQVTVQQITTHKNGQWLKVKFQGIDQGIKELGRKAYRLRQESQQAKWPGEENSPYMAVARELLNTVTPDLAGEQLQEKVGKLANHIGEVVDSDFEIIS